MNKVEQLSSLIEKVNGEGIAIVKEKLINDSCICKDKKLVKKVLKAETLMALAKIVSELGWYYDAFIGILTMGLQVEAKKLNLRNKLKWKK